MRRPLAWAQLRRSGWEDVPQGLLCATLQALLLEAGSTHCRCDDGELAHAGTGREAAVLERLVAEPVAEIGRAHV